LLSERLSGSDGHRMTGQAADAEAQTASRGLLRVRHDDRCCLKGIHPRMLGNPLTSSAMRAFVSRCFSLSRQPFPRRDFPPSERIHSQVRGQGTCCAWRAACTVSQGSSVYAWRNLSMYNRLCRTSPKNRAKPSHLDQILQPFVGKLLAKNHPGSPTNTFRRVVGPRFQAAGVASNPRFPACRAAGLTPHRM